MRDPNDTILLLSLRCNNNCRMCAIGDESIKDISTSDAKKLILGFKKRGLETVCFTGGECTLRKDLEELISYTRGQGLKAYIDSNGRNYSSLNFSEKLLKAGATDLSITFLGVGQVHNYMARRPHAYAEVIKGVQNLMLLKKKYSFELNFNILVHKNNYQSLQKFLPLILKYKPDTIHIVIIKPFGNALEEMGDLLVRYDKLLPFLNKFLEQLPGDVNNLSLWNLPECFYRRLSQKSQDKVSYIPIVWVDKYFKDDKDYLIAQKTKRKILTCKDCKLYKKCFGLYPNYVKFFGWTGLKPII